MKKVGFVKSVFGRLIIALLIAISVSAMLYTSSDKVQNMVHTDFNIEKVAEKSVAQASFVSVEKIQVKNDWTEKLLHVDTAYSFDSPAKTAEKSPEEVTIKTVNKEEWVKKAPVKKQKALNKSSVGKKEMKTSTVKQKEEEILVAKYVTKSAIENEPLANDSIAREIELFEKYLAEVDNKMISNKIPAVADISTENRILGPVTVEEEQRSMEINFIKMRDDSSNELLLMQRTIVTEMPFDEQLLSVLPKDRIQTEVMTAETILPEETEIPTQDKKEQQEVDDAITIYEEKSGIAEESLKQQEISKKLTESLLIAEKQKEVNIVQKMEEAEKAKMEEAAKIAERSREKADLKASAQKQKRKVEKQPEDVTSAEITTEKKVEETEIATFPVVIEKKVYSFKEDLSIALKTINSLNNPAYHARPDGSAIYTERFSEVRNFYYGRAAVRNEGKWFFIDTTGMQVSKQYWSAWNYKEGFAVVAERDSVTGVILYHHIDTEGKEMYSEKFKDLSDFKKVDENGNWTSELPKVNLVAFGRKIVTEKNRGKTTLKQVIYQIDGYGTITPYTGTLDTRFK